MSEPQGPVAVDRGNVFTRLYHGETDFNIVGRWKLWFVISGVVLAVGLGALFTKGLNFGIDFTGGTVWEVPAGNAKVPDVERAMGKLGYNDVQVQEVTQATSAGTQRVLRVEAEATASPATETTDALQTASADLDKLAGTVKGDSRTEVERVRGNLDGIDGPFADPIPDELADLQKRIDAFPDELKAASDGTAYVKKATTAMQADVDALATLEQAQREKVGRAVSEELASLTGSTVKEVTVDTVGPSWGNQISQKARTALIVFLIAITIYITLRFEFRMAVATLAALVHDLLVVVGVYAVFQFPVTPATVIALLTILGFSIYDGIVVFDRVDENTKLLGRKARMNYSEMANLSLNQVLMRSLNTSITAVLPILAVLVLGSFVLGVTTLEEFGLALFLGLLSGAYSSIFIATPMLALLKEREPRYRDLRLRLAEQPLAAAPVAGDTGTDEGDVGSGEAATVAVPGGLAHDRPSDAITPRPRKKGKKR